MYVYKNVSAPRKSTYEMALLHILTSRSDPHAHGILYVYHMHIYTYKYAWICMDMYGYVLCLYLHISFYIYSYGHFNHRPWQRPTPGLTQRYSAQVSTSDIKGICEAGFKGKIAGRSLNITCIPEI